MIWDIKCLAYRNRLGRNFRKVMKHSRLDSSLTVQIVCFFLRKKSIAELLFWPLIVSWKEIWFFYPFRYHGLSKTLISHHLKFWPRINFLWFMCCVLFLFSSLSLKDLLYLALTAQDQTKWSMNINAFFPYGLSL